MDQKAIIQIPCQFDQSSANIPRFHPSDLFKNLTKPSNSKLYPLSFIDSKFKSTFRQSFNCLDNEQNRVHEKFIPLTLHYSSKKFDAIAKFIDVYSKGHTAPAKLPLIELLHDIFQ